MLLQGLGEQGKKQMKSLLFRATSLDVNETLKRDQIPAVCVEGKKSKRTKSPRGQGQSSPGYATELWDAHLCRRRASLSGQWRGAVPHLELDQNSANMRTPEFIYIG